jgi:hypothetical protein
MSKKMASRWDEIFALVISCHLGWAPHWNKAPYSSLDAKIDEWFKM